jgi:hypothetical protein
VKGGIHAFFDIESEGIDRVVWWVDNLRYRNDDLFAPYDLVPAGGGLSGKFDTRTLADGTHELKAEAVGTNGSKATVVASFKVSNGTATPTDPPPTSPPPVPTPTPEPPPPAPTPGMPTRDAIVSDAGLSNPGALKASGSVVADKPGAVVQNLDISGAITVNADNVTIRNVRVAGSSSTALIKIAEGVRNTTIEDCKIEVSSGGANGGIGYLGYDTTVRRCEITGYADGIKAESGGLYEYNYIHMSKPAGSAKHLDGIQGSGDSNYTIRRNVIDSPISAGGNSAIFVQAWWGQGNSHVHDVVVEQNYVSGGNYVVYLEGGKDKDGSNPASWVHDYRLIDNVFGPSGNRYGLLRVANCAETTVQGNTLIGGGTVNVC